MPKSWMFCLGLIATVGCAQNDSALTVNEVRQVTRREIPRTVSDVDRFGWQGGMPVANNAGGAGPKAAGGQTVALNGSEWNFSYDLPKGWAELPTTQFRNPNLAFGEKQEGHCYVTVLSGSGGGLEQNVNRWRTQMSQPALTAEQIAALPKLELLGQPAVYVEIAGSFTGMGAGSKLENALMLGALSELEGHAVFIKCVAPKALAEAEREHFKSFVASLKRSAEAAASGESAGTTASMKVLPDGHPPMPSGGEMPAGHPPMESAGSAQLPDGHPSLDASNMPGASATTATMAMPPAVAGGSGSDQLEWSAPKEWQARTDQPMRAAGFRVPGQAGEADCGIFLLPGAAGGVEANINRWRRQIGLAPASADEIAKLATEKIAGQAGKYVELNGTFKGMQGPEQPNSMLLGVICELGQQTLFVKMTGPQETVKANKETFLKLCRDLKLK